MPIKQSILLESAQKPFAKMAFSANHRLYISAFLSHSHLDAKLAEGIQKWFYEQGLDVYIDWQDATMPEKTNTETAKKIQDKINGNTLFFFLATQNSIKSRWCPWEIGFANGIGKRIFIIPTEDDKGTAYGNEYLGLYPSIRNAIAGEKRGYAIFQPGENNGQWLTMGELLK